MFEDDALQWEERLNRINTLFDVWIDVQRRWVYLEGIFTGSADIKHLLPNETQRFQSISSEFLALMKKVAKSPLVMDILNIPGVQKSLERLADLLGKIQKALGEYLERERASFPRSDPPLSTAVGAVKYCHQLITDFYVFYLADSTLWEMRIFWRLLATARTSLGSRNTSRRCLLASTLSFSVKTRLKSSASLPKRENRYLHLSLTLAIVLGLVEVYLPL